MELVSKRLTPPYRPGFKPGYKPVTGMPNLIPSFLSKWLYGLFASLSVWLTPSLILAGIATLLGLGAAYLFFQSIIRAFQEHLDSLRHLCSQVDSVQVLAERNSRSIEATRAMIDHYGNLNVSSREYDERHHELSNQISNVQTLVEGNRRSLVENRTMIGRHDIFDVLRRQNIVHRRVASEAASHGANDESPEIQSDFDKDGGPQEWVGDNSQSRNM